MKIRNEVAAHMFSDDVGIESAAAWVVSRSVMPKTDHAMFSSLIFSRSIQVLRALHTLVKHSRPSVECDSEGGTDQLGSSNAPDSIRVCHVSRTNSAIVTVPFSARRAWRASAALREDCPWPIPSSLRSSASDFTVVTSVRRIC